MDLESESAFRQVVPGILTDPPSRVTVELEAVPGQGEVWMYLDDDSARDAAIQLSFTRDQMREHIVQCQKVMGSLPA